jgi:hypothetical protein
MIPKFRVWDKLDKEIYGVEEINWFDGEFDFIGDGITFKRDADEVELMQSTGLFDKEGTEVFEGDIISIELEEIETPINAKIFQNNKIGMLMFHVFEDNEDVPMVELLEENSVAFAVIGNIYENPELLEVEE